MIYNPLFFLYLIFSALRKCQKIGEGVFGEVFLNDTYVLKIIPIEGDEEINGAQQKRFDEILQEVIISQELSALRHGENNRSGGFVEVLNVRLVEGRYPEHLLNLWDDYDIRQVSENDRPDIFCDNQLYVVFELANSGCDLEAHVFKNAEQSYSAFQQVTIPSQFNTFHYALLFCHIFLDIFVCFMFLYVRSLCIIGLLFTIMIFDFCDG